MAGEEAIEEVEDRSKDGPACRCENPPQPDSSVRLSECLYAMCLATVAVDPMEAAHQIGKRNAILTGIEAGRRDILECQFPGAVQVSQPPGLEATERALTVIQDLKMPVCHPGLLAAKDDRHS
jgi:hypothetical protein